MALQKTIPWALMVIFLAGCMPVQVTTRQPTSAPVLPSPSATASAPTPVPSPTPPVLTADVLKNMEYDLPVSQKRVELTDGKYQEKTGVESLTVGMAEPIGFGDLDGDGFEDAAVVLGENTGGTGTFQSLIVVMNKDGTPFQGSFFQLGDRVRIDAITIQDQHVKVDAIVHGPQDPLCCPSLPETQTFRLTRAGLQIDSVVSKTPDGRERAIQIDTPTEGTRVGSPVDVKGSVTIAPFENNLVYRIVTEENQQVAEGPIQVNSSEPGGEGTFTVAIDFRAAPTGQPVWLEIVDLSAADGSILALSSVGLVRE